MASLRRTALLSLVGAICTLAAEEVVTLTTSNFDAHLKDNKHTLVEFYAPWCGHCKKLAPEYEKAAGVLKGSGIVLAKVDATEEKDLATKYNIQGFPTILWFEDGNKVEFDGGRTAEGIVEWCKSMTGPSVTETQTPDEPSSERPRVVLYAASLLSGFEEAAKANRRKAAWYFVKSSEEKVVLTHKGEEPITMSTGASDQAKVSSFFTANQLPLFGKLDGDTFSNYMQTGLGLVWSLFPMDGTMEEVEAKNRPMMTKVASKIKGKYFVTYTDTEKFKEAVENMLSVKTFPAIAVQKKAGDKKKFIYDGEMTEEKISAFIADVEAGKIEAKLKSEPVPASNDEPVKVIVGSTLQQEVFLPDKDVLLEVYAPWCGHCKKLEPEYNKLAKKIKKDGLSDLLVIAKLDGTTNDSPVESIDWSGFPTLFFIKAGDSTPVKYDGERTAKGMWKYIRKHATKAAEIKERIDKKKGDKKRGEEL